VVTPSFRSLAQLLTTTTTTKRKASLASQQRKDMGSKQSPNPNNQAPEKLQSTTLYLLMLLVVIDAVQQRSLFDGSTESRPTGFNGSTQRSQPLLFTLSHAMMAARPFSPPDHGWKARRLMTS
jgi:hypothetical protein